jgi:hypothetical protein
MRTLTEIMNHYGSDKGNSHTYTTFYEQIFDNKRLKPISLLEIGIGTLNKNIESNMTIYNNYSPGASLRGWEEYFPKGEIYGCDIDENVLFETKRISTFFVDQKDFRVIEKQICNNKKNYDIIIDDGLHDFHLNWLVLKQIYHKLNKGGIYIIEDVSSYDPSIMNESFVKINQNKGAKFEYLPLEKNEVNNNNLFIVYKPVNSFDMFDTLVFRINKTPESVLELVNKDDEYFLKNRQKAEKNSRDKTLVDIYEELQKHYKWSDKQKHYYMQKEMDLEYNNLFPIEENVRKVEEDDIIISDMYLPKYFLEKILQDKCGLKNKVIVTYDGKYTGSIWDKVGKIGQHMGDNKHSDIDIPSKYGIKCLLTEVSDYTKQEKYWVEHQNKDIANIMRFCRLQCPYDEGGMKEIYLTSINYNIPFLLIFCFYINSIYNNDLNIVFSTRDCSYLYLLYRLLFPDNNVKLFFTSRKCYNEPSESYHQYIKDIISYNTLIIDIQGSGNSFNNYFKNTVNRNDVKLQFLNNLVNIYPSDIFEILNTVRYGTCIDVEDSVPIILPLEYPEYIVYPIEKVVGYCLYFIKLKRPNISFNLQYLKKYFDKFPITKQKLSFLTKFHHSVHKYDSKSISKNNYIKINDFFNQFITKPLITKNKINIPIYIINRKQDQTRIVYMYDLLKKLNISLSNVKIINPFPANNQTKNHLIKYINPPHFICSNTQASHSLTYLNIIDNAPEEKILVLEDDIAPINSIQDTKIILQFIIEYSPPEADLIYLEYCNEICNEKNKKVFNEMNRPYCTAAIYYPSKKSRKKLLHQMRIFHNDKDYLATDNTIARLIQEKLISAYEHEPLFIQDKNFGSNIDGSLNDALPLCENRENYQKTFYNIQMDDKNNQMGNNKIFYIIILVLGILFLGICLYIKLKKK